MFSKREDICPATPTVEMRPATEASARGQLRFAGLAQIDDAMQRRGLERRIGIVDQRPAEMTFRRQPDAMAEGVRHVAGFGDPRGDGKRTRGLFLRATPMRFERVGEFAAQRIDIGSGRHVDRLRREAAELVVGEDIGGAGAGLARA